MPTAPQSFCFSAHSLSSYTFAESGSSVEAVAISMKSEIKKCECGLVWKLTRIKTPYGIRDTDSLACDCGHELIAWNGGHMYTAEKVPEETSKVSK